MIIIIRRYWFWYKPFTLKYILQNSFKLITLCLAYSNTNDPMHGSQPIYTAIDS
jgi:hypothetical protein